MLSKKINLTLCLALTSTLSAGTYSDRGFYGSLGYTYEAEETSSNSYKSSRESFSQLYMLGYQGFIYSPSLFDYTIDGSVRLYDEDINNNGQETKSTNSNEGYNADLRFIQNTKYPFRINLNTQKSPKNIVSYNNVLIQTYETDSKSINGSMDFNPYMFTYGVVMTKGVSESASSTNSIETNIYNSALNYNNDTYSASIRYQRREETNLQQYLDNNASVATSNTKQILDTLDINYRWDISKDLKFNSNASYMQDDLYSSKVMLADVDFQWEPQQKYKASLQMGTYRYESLDDIMDSYNLNQNFIYKFTPFFYIAQNVSIYTINSSNMSSDSLSLSISANHSYQKVIFKDTNFNLTTTLSAQENELNRVLKADNNTSNSKKETYRLNINANTITPLESMNSKLRFGSSYSHSITSDDETFQASSLNLSLTSRLLRIVSNNIAANYTQTESYNASADGIKVNNSSTSRSLSESMNFPVRLGIRGGMSFGAGVTSSTITNNGSTMSSTSPSANMSLNYRFFTKLMFNSGINVNQNFNTLIYNGNANLTFKAGKTFFSMGYQYNKSNTDGTVFVANSERATFKVTLTRRF